MAYVTNYYYMGLNLDAKLWWISYLKDFTKFTACWSNFLRSVLNS